MAVDNYGRTALRLNEIIGFLFRGGAEEAAHLIVNDNRHPAAASLLSYERDKDSIVFSGLQLVADGKIEILKEAVQQHPNAAKALLVFGSMNDGDIYRLALKQKDAATFEGVLELMKTTLGAEAFSYIDTHMLQRQNLQSAFTSDKIEHIKALKAAVESMNLDVAQANDFKTWLKSIATNILGGGSGPSYLQDRSAEGILGNINNMKNLLEADADQFIRAALPGLIRTTVRDDSRKKSETLSMLFNEAALAGLPVADILTQEDKLGRSLMDHAAETCDSDTMNLLLEKVKEMGDAESTAWIKNWLGKKRATIDRDISSELQEVKRDLNQDEAAELDGLLPYNSGLEKWDGEKLRQHLIKIQPTLLGWLERNPPKDKSDTARKEKIKAFADQCGPVIEGPTIVGFAHGALGVLLNLKATVENLDRQQLADAFFEDMSRPMGRNETGMHRGWASSNVLGPPGSENSVSEGFSGFVAKLDSVFGTDIAVPLLKRLFALKDSKGATPLESTLYDGPEGKYAKYYYPAMIKGLAATLADDAKFTRYMDEAIMPNMPVAFGGGGGKPQAASVSKYLNRSGPVPE